MKKLLNTLNRFINMPLKWEKDAIASTPVNGIGYLPLVSIFVATGIFFVALGNIVGRIDRPDAQVYFWVGLIFIVLPVVVRFFSYSVSHVEAVGLLILYSIGTFATSYLRTPDFFRSFDESLHWRTAYDILQLKHLFTYNSMLPISPLYPGLESVTTALVNMTGLSINNAAHLVIFISRVLMMLSLYLLYEQITESIRASGLGALVYSGSSTFVFFHTQYAYETMALPIAVLCLFLLVRQAKGVSQPWLWKIFIGLVLFTIVPTHHVTTYVLIGLLAVWTGADIFVVMFGAKSANIGWAAFILVAMVWFWVGVMSPNTIDYLTPIINGSFNSFYNLITGQSGVRTLFENNAGQGGLIFEKLTGIASVLVLTAIIPIGLWHAWLKHRRESFVVMLSLLAASYPLLPLMRLSGGSWQLSNRLSGSVFIGLGLIAAFALAEFPVPSRLVHLRLWAGVLGVMIIFLGGVIAGAPRDSRLAQSYRPAAEERSVDNQGIHAAEWVRSALHPGNPVMSDRIGSQLLGSYGVQRVITNLSDRVSVSGIFLRFELTEEERDILQKTQTRYLLIDRRITTARPILGMYYESWEHLIVLFTPPPSISVLNKFDYLPGVSRIYDSGDIVIYDVGPLNDETQ